LTFLIVFFPKICFLTLSQVSQDYYINFLDRSSTYT